MKIDLHIHTKKTKSGDAKTRNVSADKFHEKLIAANVKIAAITNHNDFDIIQYNEFCEKVGEEIQLWPGIELDVVDGENKGHLIVIVSPFYAAKFHSNITNLINSSTPDAFSISIDKLVEGVDSLNPLYIAHYHTKKPDFNEESFKKILDRTQHKNRVLIEVTNAISAGIYISHGQSSIYGSDLHDWDVYDKHGKDLPELRLPVESFEQFCLLLDKDIGTINTLLNKKTPETFSVMPFEDDTQLKFKFFNDINIFFGSKGTGKTKILEAIAKHYTNNGIEANVFKPSAEKLEESYDLKGIHFVIDLNEHGIDYCTNEFEAIKKSTEKDVTRISSYREHFSVKLTNKNAQKFLINNFQLLNVQSNERNLQNTNTVYDKLINFISFIKDEPFIQTLINGNLYNQLVEILGKVRDEISDKRENYFFDSKADKLFNNLVEIVKNEIAKKINIPPKPPTTGFHDYISNRISIELTAKKISENINKKIILRPEKVGNLGLKGDLFCVTNVIIQNGTIHDTEYKTVAGVNKTPQKRFVEQVDKILRNVFSDNLFEEVSSLNKIDYIDTIKTINELLLFKRCFKVNDKDYRPSNGESSMLLLHQELNKEKDIFILDEPEKSLGNDYINDVIVPMIKNKAKIGKKIFISTHDANIAVRTLPYNSIYRMHDLNEYRTYIGNPFTNKLINVNNDNDKIDWKWISMKTLEGGEEAFGERGKIYGNL